MWLLLESQQYWQVFMLNLFKDKGTIYHHFKHNFGCKLVNPTIDIYSKSLNQHNWWLYINHFFKDGIYTNVERDSRDFKLFIGFVEEEDLKFYNPEKQRVFFEGFIFSEKLQQGMAVWIPEKLACNPNWRKYEKA